MAKVKDRYLKPVLKLYDINKRWICNLTTNNPKNSIFNLKKNMKVNEIDTLSFQVAFDNTHISPNSCEMLIKHEFDWYIIKSVTLNSGDTRYLNVECESEFTISKTVLCETIEIIGETPEQMFNAIMNSVPDNKLNYVFKETDVTNRRSLIVESETSLFENLIKMAEAFECTIRFSYGSNGEKYVSFIKEPHDRGRVIRRNNNLKNLNIAYDTSELFTKIMPFGADDDGIEINIGDVNPTKKLYVENYDYFIAKGMTEGQIKNNMQTQALKVIKYADIVDENDLYNLALRDLAKYSKPRVKGNVEYADLSVLEDSISVEPMIHEKIKIADSEIKMMLTSNISEIEIDYENILNSKITLDNVIEYNSIFKDLIAQGEKIDSVISINPNTGKPSLVGNAIQGKIDTAITEIVGQVGVAGKMKPYAILFECNIEGHDLYGAMALGTNGLLIAKEKNIDNSWKWKTAINANGIYADELVGLRIIGEQIVAGIISSIDKSTWINLEDGTFNFGDKVKFDGKKFTVDLSGEDLTTNESIKAAFKIMNDSISSKVSNGEFESYKEQTDREIASKIEGKDVSTIVKQNADSWGVSIGGKLKGTNYKFDGEHFIIGDLNAENKAYHSLHGSRWRHADGSYTQADADGIFRYHASSKRSYHHLMHAGTVQVENTVWVNLPSHIANKVGINYAVSISVKGYGFNDNKTGALMQVYCTVLSKSSDAFQIRVVLYGWRPEQNNWRGQQTIGGWVNVDYVIIA